MCSSTGVALRFVVRPSRLHDNTAVDNVACTLPFDPVLLGDRGYVSELQRHQLNVHYDGTMIAIHRANMHPKTPAEQRLLRMKRKHIKICNCQLEKMGVAQIHAQLSAGISLKIAASLCVECVKSLLD